MGSQYLTRMFVWCVHRSNICLSCNCIQETVKLYNKNVKPHDTSIIKVLNIYSKAITKLEVTVEVSFEDEFKCIFIVIFVVQWFIFNQIITLNASNLIFKLPKHNNINRKQCFSPKKVGIYPSKINVSRRLIPINTWSKILETKA